MVALVFSMDMREILYAPAGSNVRCVLSACFDERKLESHSKLLGSRFMIEMFFFFFSFIKCLAEQTEMIPAQNLKKSMRNEVDENNLGLAGPTRTPSQSPLAPA